MVGTGNESDMAINMGDSITSASNPLTAARHSMENSLRLSAARQSYARARGSAFGRESHAGPHGPSVTVRPSLSTTLRPSTPGLWSTPKSRFEWNM